MTTVSLEWVLNQLAGMKFPEQGQAYDFIKSSYLASIEDKEAGKEIEFALKEGFLEIKGGMFMLTPKGLKEGARLINEVGCYPIWVSNAWNELEVSVADDLRR